MPGRFCPLARDADVLIVITSTFATGQNVDCVETDKHRIVLIEIEKGWWILAVWAF